MQDSDRGVSAKVHAKFSMPRPLLLPRPPIKREQLTDLLEYSSILCAIAIKKQQIAVPEHKQRRPKILEVSICAFSTEILWIFYCDIHET